MRSCRNLFSLLVSLEWLDLSTFDTIDHAVLLKLLNCSFGITGTVYSWLQSYLTGRTPSVRIGIHSSPCYPISSPVGVPKALSFFYLDLTYFHYCSVSTCQPTAICRRHAFPCHHQLITPKVSVYFSLASTLSIFGFVKTAWPSIQINQLLFCLVHNKSSNLCSGSNLSMYIAGRWFSHPTVR